MKVYEMSLIQGFEDPIRQLYLQNNEQVRKSFIEKIEMIIFEELKSSLMNLKNEGLINFYNDIYCESYAYLVAMKDDFILHGYAEYQPHYFLKVEERLIL